MVSHCHTFMLAPRFIASAEGQLCLSKAIRQPDACTRTEQMLITLNDSGLRTKNKHYVF